MNTPETKPFSWPVRVYWEDTDAGGIVFYANYLKFFERARTEWLRARGLNQRSLQAQTGGMFVVRHTNVAYHAPARLDDALRITVQTTALGRASVDVQQAAYLDQGAAAPLLLCAGTISLAWVDAQRMAPTRLPPTVLDVLK